MTSLSLPGRDVVQFYDNRGTTEQRGVEGKQAMKMTWLSRRRFGSNEVRLCQSIAAYKLGNLWRRLACRSS